MRWFFIPLFAGFTVLAGPPELPENSPASCERVFARPPELEARAQRSAAQASERVNALREFAATHEIAEGTAHRARYESLLSEVSWRLREAGLRPSDVLPLLRSLPLPVRVEVFADWVKPLARPAQGPGAVSYNVRLRFGRCLAQSLTRAELQELYDFGARVPCASSFKYEYLYWLLRSDLPAFQSIADTNRAAEITRSLTRQSSPRPRVVRICHWVNPAFFAGGDCRLREFCDEADNELRSCGIDVIRLNSPSLETLRQLSRHNLPEGTIVFVDSHGGRTEGDVSLPQHQGSRLTSQTMLGALPPGNWNVWLDACHSGNCTAAPSNIGFAATCRADQTSAMSGPFTRALQGLLCHSNPQAVEAWRGLNGRPALLGGLLDIYLSRVVGREANPPYGPEYRPGQCRPQNPVVGNFTVPARLYGPRIDDAKRHAQVSSRDH